LSGPASPNAHNSIHFVKQKGNETVYIMKHVGSADEFRTEKTALERIWKWHQDVRQQPPSHVIKLIDSVTIPSVQANFLIFPLYVVPLLLLLLLVLFSV
jgi:hypothetical protein